MPFTAHYQGTDKLGLASFLKAFANDQWIDEQACEAVLNSLGD